MDVGISSLMTIGLMTAFLTVLVWFVLTHLIARSEAREIEALLAAELHEPRTRSVVMLRSFMEAGPLIFPVLILGLVVLALSVYNLWGVLARSRFALEERRRSIDSVLVWGGWRRCWASWGQWIGLNKMARIVAERGFVNPEAVSIGLSESLLTPVAGMLVFVAAAFLWFFLRIALWSLTERPV